MLKEYTEEEKAYFIEASKRGAPKCWHAIRQSENPVERAFDGLDKDKKAIIIRNAKLEIADLIYPYSRGYKLRDYTPEGQRKIGAAVREMREISQSFPWSITDKDFNKIDKKVNYAK